MSSVFHGQRAWFYLLYFRSLLKYNLFLSIVSGIMGAVILGSFPKPFLIIFGTVGFAGSIFCFGARQGNEYDFFRNRGISRRMLVAASTVMNSALSLMGYGLLKAARLI